MAIQTINLGTEPNGVGGDTNRSANVKINNNFTDNANAASRLVGTASGNVMEVGAFGLGSSNQNISANTIKGSGFYQNSEIVEGGYQWGNYIEVNGSVGGGQIYFGAVESNLVYIRTRYANSWGALKLLRHSGNTTIDSNGFIKAASPVVQLFADKIMANEEAKEQDITFEKVDIGHYLVKGSSGFAQEGWYIEQPTDSNGNLYHLVEYQTLENGDIEVKTFDYFLDKRGRIVADYNAPLDIEKDRWIDLRLQEVPKPVPGMPDEVTYEPQW